MIRAHAWTPLPRLQSNSAHRALLALLEDNNRIPLLNGKKQRKTLIHALHRPTPIFQVVDSICVRRKFPTVPNSGIWGPIRGIKPPNSGIAAEFSVRTMS